MIKNILKKFIMLFNIFGFEPKKIINNMRGLPKFINDYIFLKKHVNQTLFPIALYPMLADQYKQGGTAKGHYFHQDLIVAQKIYKSNPVRHMDIGSRVDGFIAHIAVFRKIEIIDIRKIKSSTKNIEFLQSDMMEIKQELYESCDSLSSLHALEHFGLGRYSDPLDIEGHLKGFENMYHILKPDGMFYFSVPIGKQRIEFNAHRVFSLEYLLDMFKSKFEVIDFSYVDDIGELHEHILLTKELISNNCNCHYGCGIFELKKKN